MISLIVLVETVQSPDISTLFFAVVGGGVISGVVQKIINVFIDRFVAKPLDNQLEKYTKVVVEKIKEMNDEEKRDFAKVEKEILILKGEGNVRKSS